MWLDSIIDELREIKDIEARASLTETIVKVLAKRKPDRCRQMLNSLFDEALQMQEAKVADDDPQNLILDSTIRKIIQIAASFDRQLAQSYIDKYTKEQDSNNTAARSNTRSLTATEMFLKVAGELIEQDPVLALTVAERAVKAAVPPEALTFLGMLRKKDRTLADRFLASALRSIEVRGGTDVNELFLLYSYIFSPLQVPRVRPEGLALLQLPEYFRVAESYPVNLVSAKQYLETVTRIVTNAARYDPANPKQLVAGAAGDIFLVNIIEPYIATYAPFLTQSLLAQRYLLTNYLQAEQRNETQEQLERWTNLHSRANPSSENKLENVDYFLQWAEQISDPKRKNQLYFRAAAVAVREKKFDQALEIVEKMSIEYRDQAKQLMSFQIAEQFARDGQLEKAEQLARRNSDLTQRACIFTLIANSLLNDTSRDVGRASEFLSEAEQLAQKLDKQEEKIAVLFGAASVYSRFDSARASDLLRDAIKAANKVETFAGDIRINRTLNIGGFSFFYPLYSNEFSLAGVVSRLGRINFNGTQFDVQLLKSRVARLRAIVALCTAVLTNNTAGNRVAKEITAFSS